MKGRKTNGGHRVPPYVGEQGLSRLVSKARNEYQEEVLTGRKSYRRYCNDLLASIVHHDATDAWSRNEHDKNLRAVTDLLTLHRHLVEYYFGRAAFSAGDYQELMERFNKEDSPNPLPTAVAAAAMPNTSPGERPAVKRICADIRLGDQVISLIVHCANEAELFSDVLTREHFEAYYNGEPLTALRARKNTHVVLFFKMLEDNGLIQRNWQHIIANEKLVVSSSNKGFLTKAVMSSTLHRVNEEAPVPADIKRLRNIVDKHLTEYKRKYSN